MKGWTVNSSVDEKGEHFEVLPPDVSAAEFEIIAEAMTRLCNEYLAGKRRWEDFPEESRPWLCSLFLNALEELANRSKDESKIGVASRITDVILSLATLPEHRENFGKLDRRMLSDDEKQQLAAARSIAAKQVRLPKRQRDSLRSRHSKSKTKG